MQLIAIALLFLTGGAPAPGKCPPLSPRIASVRELTNDELIAALRPGPFEPAGTPGTWVDRVTLAVKEVERRGETMIPLLASLKGCRETFFGGGLGNPMSAFEIPAQDTATGQKAIPLEQAAIYMIVGIYRGSFAHAQSPYLVDLRIPSGKRPASVSPQLDERAWRSVDRWLTQWRASNLAELRRRKQDPLAGSQLAFW